MKVHPCLSCGACCAFYRVSFHWSETLKESFGVPLQLTSALPPHRNVMKGTDQKNPRCVAFKGTVGVAGHCGIYENRPGCCRDFKASFEDGVQSASCDNARSRKNLRLLVPADWT